MVGVDSCCDCNEDHLGGSVVPDVMAVLVARAAASALAVTILSASEAAVVAIVFLLSVLLCQLQ
jgi:hypothetical protein